MINQQELDLLRDALGILEEGAADLPSFTPQFDATEAGRVLGLVAQRMQNNYPYFHPQYAGQMLKPPHPIARMAYALSMWVNPNNHALDGGRASSAMELECVADLGRMFGWETPLGHLAGGGTMANLEALWVAGRLAPEKRIVASDQAHYTHSRITDVLRIPFSAVPVDNRGRMDANALKTLLQQGDVGTVVVTIGNTGLGAIDPLHEVLKLRQEFDFRIHVDAAYGGYFGLATETSDSLKKIFEQLTEVDSIVIDPHKHGLQPYGCGCVLFRDPSVGRLYKHDSPYTYFSSSELHLGEITLECSRPGATAVALWATHQLLPPVPGGEFANGLDGCLRAARALWQALEHSDRFTPLMEPELDIVVFAANAATTSDSSQRAQAVFDNAAEQGLHLALIELPTDLVRHYAPEIAVDGETMTCLRSVLMKPEHEAWLEKITTLLEASAE
jgi:glutamate/tyrosine decarboxylase-like PLP-dependent enzyme